MQGCLKTGMYKTSLKRWKTGTLQYILKAVVAHIDARGQEALGPGFVLKASRAQGTGKKCYLHRKAIEPASRGVRR